MSLMSLFMDGSVSVGFYSHDQTVLLFLIYSPPEITLMKKGDVYVYD